MCVGLDSKNLELSVTSGDVVLKSLSLKKSALKDLELPIRVKEGNASPGYTNPLVGSLGQLTMKIPWANLGTEAAIVRISEVFLLCEPKERSAVCAITPSIDQNRVLPKKKRTGPILQNKAGCSLPRF